MIQLICLLIHNACRCHLALGFVYFSENFEKMVVMFPVLVNSDMMFLR